MTEKDNSETLNSIKVMLAEQSAQNKSVLTFKEAAKFLDLSTSYLYKLTSRSEIPHYKPNNKKIFFNRIELEKYLQRNRVMSNDEVDSKAATFVTLKKGKQ